MCNRDKDDGHIRTQRWCKRKRMAGASSVAILDIDEWSPRDAWMKELVDAQLRELYKALPSVKDRTEWNLCRQEMITLVFVYNAVRIGIAPVSTTRLSPANSSAPLRLLLEENYQC